MVGINSSSEPQSDRTHTEWRPTWALSAVLGRPETDMTDRKRTPVCELLGIEFPIVEAPVAADPRLPAAVSNAGGLGTLGLGGPMMPEPWSGKRQPSPTGRLPATSFSPGISTIESIRHCRRVCGSFRSSGAIRAAATSTRCMTPERACHAHCPAALEEARRAVGCGVDIVIAQGWEAGGHVWSGVATLPRCRR